MKNLSNVKIATSFSDKLFGLLKKSNPRCLLFKTRWGIHTFFLKEPIDVTILDQNFQVVRVVTVKPNRLFFWSPKYNLVLELPEGTIRKKKIKIGDLLSF